MNAYRIVKMCEIQERVGAEPSEDHFGFGNKFAIREEIDMKFGNVPGSGDNHGGRG